MVSNADVTTQDHVIQHKLGCLWLPARTADGLEPTGATNSPLTSVGAGASAAAWSEISTFGFGGLKMDTADDISWLIDVPSMLNHADLSRDMLLQIVASSLDTADSTTVDWKAFVKGFSASESFTVFTSAPDASLVFNAYTILANSKPIATERRALAAAGTFASDESIGITVELDDKGSAAANEICLRGARLWYTEEICEADGVRKFT